MGIEEIIKSQTEFFKANKDKLISKMSFSSLSCKAILPFDMSEGAFNDMVSAYVTKFPYGTILDAIWEHNTQRLMQSGKISEQSNRYWEQAMIYQSYGQIAEIEGRYDVALKCFFEHEVYDAVGYIENRRANAHLLNKSISNEDALQQYIERRKDYFHPLSAKRIKMISKKMKITPEQALDLYHYNLVETINGIAVSVINSTIRKLIVDANPNI